MTKTGQTVWQVLIRPRDGQSDRLAEEVIGLIQFGDLDLIDDDQLADFKLSSGRGFLLQGQLERDNVERIARQLLVETVVGEFEVCQVSEAPSPQDSATQTVHVLPKPGVTDAEADSALHAIHLLGEPVTATRTFRRFDIDGLTKEQCKTLAQKLLANESIERVILGPLDINRLDVGNEYEFDLQNIPILQASESELQEISKSKRLSLTLVEMQTIRDHYLKLDREPTDIELETIAQTWSEHCSHKTLAGRIEYTDEHGTRQFDNMLKETIFAATVNIREQLGEDDWCVSVFKDNAGIVKFDDSVNLTFKVETHNRPSAIEPYGGASTGIGGVIRDTLGTGMGAKPICNTDVFCFADPNTPASEIPPGVLHPRRIMKGVVSGVRDYGNRMGIPTINGAVYFDQRYIGNPLVFCGNVGMISQEHSFKEPQPNDLIVSIGGRTGRDGIHGATFSSAELTEASETTSSGAVQIGNPIVEKTVVDVLLQARDQGLYNAVTDCGAGGFSSAVGEMGEEIGAEVWLDKAPLKYEGLSYTEIWISEAQERMVCSVPENKWAEFESLCDSENVEATVIGRFVPTNNLTLKYKDQVVGELSMEFMHDGRPPTVRKADYRPTEAAEINLPEDIDPNESLLQILGSLNVASKHWIIRQYDHEVLGRSVLKPLVGVANDGPGDASVIRPRLDSERGAAVSCGMNPYFGDYDTYHMAASSINEAIRNCVAVGADPKRIAILDNFCWGYTDRPETLGSLVRAALACQDVAEAYQTPFISGKDSLNNEFSYTDESGERQTISIPPTLLISAIGQVDNVNQCVSMDFKASGNLIYLLGETHDELGGSHLAIINHLNGGNVPQVDLESSRRLFEQVHSAISNGWIRSCHDLSEGGLAVALSEMAIAGNIGCDVNLANIDIEHASIGSALVKMFSESNSRFLVEILPEHQQAFESSLEGSHCVQIGETNDGLNCVIREGTQTLIQLELSTLREAWQKPLDWNMEYQMEKCHV